MRRLMLDQRRCLDDFVRYGRQSIGCFHIQDGLTQAGRRGIRVLLACTVAIAGVAAAEATDALDASAITAMVAAGDTCAARLDLPAAITSYRAAYDAAPDRYDAAWRLARVLADKAALSQGREEQRRLCLEAESAARRAVRLNATDSNGHTALAIAVGRRALLEGGKRKVELSKEVLAEAVRALECNPNDDVAHHVLGVWNREIVELSWVLKQFAEILYGRFPPASLETALGSLRRATELRPEIIPHHVELGVTLAAAGRWADAQEELERSLALPTVWVTDDTYRVAARVHLARVRSRLR